MRMINYLSLFIKKRQISLCISLTVPFIKDIQSRTIFGESWSAMCFTTLRKKNFKKLKTRFFLWLCNRGFKKYTLMKLFSKITYAQRNELLKKDTPLSNICEPITFQEAERRMILDGERALASSQEDAGVAPCCPDFPTALLSKVSTF